MVVGTTEAWPARRMSHAPQKLRSDRVHPSAWHRFNFAGVMIVVLTFMAPAITCIAVENVRDSDYDYDPPIAGSYTLPVVKTAADGVVIDSNGKQLNLRELTHGRITVLSFIYTRCGAARACPYATSILGQLHVASAQDPMLAKNMRLVSMSFDPEYDTPERLATYSEYVREVKQGCEWRFATAKSSADLDSILAGYDQVVDKRPNANDPQGPLYHILRVFLIDRQGRIRNIYSSGTLDPRLVLADVKTLLMDEARLSKQ